MSSPKLKGMRAACKPNGREASRHKLVHRPKYRTGYARNLTVSYREDVNGNPIGKPDTPVSDRPGFVSGKNTSGFNVPPADVKRKVKGI